MKKFIIIFLVIVLAAVALVACVDDPDDPVDPNIGNNKDKDDFKTPGFTQDRASASEMFHDLIGCAMQSIKLASSETVPSQAYKAAVHCRVQLDYNDIQSYLIIKGNYDHRKPEDTALIFEIYTVADDTLQIGLYFYQNENYTNLYIHLDENRIRIPLYNYNLSEIFPLEMRFDADASSLVASGFLLFMNVEGDIDYEYKTVNDYCERHYRFDVNVARSLSNLINMNSEWQENMGLSIEEIDFILNNVLGIDSADINDGNMPDTNIKVEFTTQGGHPDYYGFGKLTKLKMNFDAESMETGDTVFGKDFNLILDATQIKITNSVVSNIPAEDEFTDYVDYSDRQFRLYTAIQFEDESEACDIQLDFIYDAANAANTRFALTATGRESKQELCSVYYLDRYIYVNWKKNGTETNLQGHFDFNEFLDLVHIEAKKSPNRSVISILSYIMGSLRLQNNQSISYTFMPQFFSDFAGLEHESLLVILDECSEEDVAAVLEENSTAISELNRSFTFFIDYGVKLVEQISTFDFPDILNRLK